MLLAGLAVRGFEVRLESHQVVLRWGPEPRSVAEVPAPPPTPPPAPPHPPEAGPAATRTPADFEERLQMLNALVQGLVDEASSRDLRTQAEVARLRAEVNDLRRRDLERWVAVERDLRSLYSALVLTRKGNEP